jgi:HK97 family phage major capsid protein
MASKLQEKLDKRNTAITAGRALVDKADTEKRAMTTDEDRQYKSYLSEAETLSREISDEQRLIALEKETAEIALRTHEGGQHPPAAPTDAARSKAWRNFLVSERAAGEDIGLLASPETRSVTLPTGEVRTLTTGSDTQAGFLNAPQEFVQQLIKKVNNLVFIENLSTQHTTTNANGLGFPTLETDMGDFEMITEIKTAPVETTIAFGKREFKPHPSSKLIKISDAMLRADGMNPEAIVMERAAYKYGILKEYKYLLGTGNQEPLGLFTSSSKGIYTDRDVTMTYSDDFTGDDIVSTKYTLKAQYLRKAAWLFNRTAVAKLAKVKDGVGRYLFEMTDKIGEMDQLKGSPLYMSEYVPNTFTAGLYVGMFGDFSWYFTAQSLSLRVKRLNELFAATREVGFLFDTEFDGMPVLPEAFARMKTGTAASV